MVTLHDVFCGATSARNLIFATQTESLYGNHYACSPKIYLLPEKTPSRQKRREGEKIYQQINVPPCPRGRGLFLWGCVRCLTNHHPSNAKGTPIFLAGSSFRRTHGKGKCNALVDRPQIFPSIADTYHWVYMVVRTPLFIAN
jgi:hypothetical protein